MPTGCPIRLQGASNEGLSERNPQCASRVSVPHLYIPSTLPLNVSAPSITQGIQRTFQPLPIS